MKTLKERWKEWRFNRQTKRETRKAREDMEHQLSLRKNKIAPPKKVEIPKPPVD